MIKKLPIRNFHTDERNILKNLKKNIVVNHTKAKFKKLIVSGLNLDDKDLRTITMMWRLWGK